MSEFPSDLVRVFGKVLCVAVLAVVLYVLTAPPLILLMTRKNPREWPRLYEPLVPGFQCDWSRPVFEWYFDTVWRADMEMRGG
jgi:hypothetical protein